MNQIQTKKKHLNHHKYLKLKSKPDNIKISLAQEINNSLFLVKISNIDLHYKNQMRSCYHQDSLARKSKLNQRSRKLTRKKKCLAKLPNLKMYRPR